MKVRRSFGIAPSPPRLAPRAAGRRRPDASTASWMYCGVLAVASTHQITLDDPLGVYFWGYHTTYPRRQATGVARGYVQGVEFKTRCGSWTHTAHLVF